MKPTKASSMHLNLRSPLSRAKAISILCHLMLGVSLLLVIGCRVAQTTSKVSTRALESLYPVKKNNHAPDPVELQQNLFRFTDEFAAGISGNVDLLRRATNVQSDVALQKWRLSTVSDAWAIASGPNAFANLLDTIVLVSLTRTAAEQYWMRTLYGDEAKPLVDSCRTAETKVWQLADPILLPGQKTELQVAIQSWCDQHPPAERAFFIRALGWTSEVSRSTKSNPTQQPTSVFNLLRLDPLAGLDPAAREIAQTRLFAERAMFTAQRMPSLVRWQMELLSANLLHLPEVQQGLTNSTRLVDSVDRLSLTAEKLPAQVATERKEILDALDQQSGKLRDLAAQLKETLSAGEKMSTSLNTTLTTFDGLMKRFGVGETPPSSAPSTNAPFNILDYAKTAEQLAVASKELDIVLKDFASAMDSPAWTQRVQDANNFSSETAAHAKSILNHAFRLLVISTLLVFVCFIAARKILSRP